MMENLCSILKDMIWNTASADLESFLMKKVNWTIKKNIMDIIKIIESNGEQKIINPMHIKDVKLFPPDHATINWCIKITFITGDYMMRNYEDETSATEFFNYTENCIKSIN